MAMMRDERRRQECRANGPHGEQACGHREAGLLTVFAH